MEQKKKSFYKREPDKTAEQLRAEVLIEVNSTPVRINRLEFKKSEVDKSELSRYKRLYSKLQKNTIEYNRTLNIILSSFSSAKTPNWGSLVFNGQRV